MKALTNLLSYKDAIVPKDEGIYIGNYRCHVNALSYYLLHKEDVKAIVGGLQVFNDESSVAHFIIQLNDNTYIDPTYGNMVSTLYSYFLPVEYYKPDTYNPGRELSNLKSYLGSLLPWYLKLFKHRI